MGRVSSVPWSPGWLADSWSAAPPDGLRWARWGSGDSGGGVHLFVDDWRLESLARGRFFGSLGLGRQWATEPDFSVAPGMPPEVQGWQVYRSRYLGDRLRAAGLSVVPVLTWTGEDDPALTAWGIRPGSAVAVRAPGRGQGEADGWRAGFTSAVELVRPSFVLVFGCAGRVRGALDSLGVPWRAEPLRRSRVSTIEARPGAPAAC